MLNPRLEALRDYPFQRLRQLLDGQGPAAGLKPINLSIGEPQHAYPDFVGEILHANRHLYGQYPPPNGTPEFRAAIAAWATRRYRLAPGVIDPERHVVGLNGSREGLYMIAEVVLPRRKAGGVPLVAIPDPFYQVYAGAAVMAGAEPMFLPATVESRFLPDLDRLDRATLDRIGLMYLCSPSNPQGTVADLDYLERALELARAHDFLLVLDECYAEIYGEQPPPGGLEAASRLSGGLANLLVFHSLSKRSSVPGLRSGFAAGDPKVVAAFLKVRNYASAPSSLPVYAAAAALWRDEAHVEANRALYRAKFDAAQRLIGNRFGFYRPTGGFYLWLDVGDGEAAARTLWHKAAVRTLPGRYLSRERDGAAAPGQPYIRVALVPDLATTTEALERIRDTL